MHWKVYNIQTGQTIKAGLKDEEEAKDWLEEHRPGREDNYMYEEMDEDEELEWTEAGTPDDIDDGKVRDWTELEDEEDFEKGRYTYRTEDDDGEDPAPEGLQYDEENEDDSDEGPLL